MHKVRYSFIMISLFVVSSSVFSSQNQQTSGSLFSLTFGKVPGQGRGHGAAEERKTIEFKTTTEKTSLLQDTRTRNEFVMNEENRKRRNICCVVMCAACVGCCCIYKTCAYYGLASYNPPKFTCCNHLERTTELIYAMDYNPPFDTTLAKGLCTDISPDVVLNSLCVVGHPGAIPTCVDTKILQRSKDFVVVENPDGYEFLEPKKDLTLEPSVLPTSMPSAEPNEIEGNLRRRNITSK